MDELLAQAAKALKIPVNVMEQAVNHYPELRQEFVIYKALTYIENALDIISLVALIVFACNWVFESDCGVDTKKTRRLSMIIAIVTLALATIIHLITIVATPDIQVIMEVINK